MMSLARYFRYSPDGLVVRHLTHQPKAVNLYSDKTSQHEQYAAKASSYYKVNNQSAIDIAAGKVLRESHIKSCAPQKLLILSPVMQPSVRLTPYMILYSSGKSPDGSHLLVKGSTHTHTLGMTFPTDCVLVCAEKCTVPVERAAGQNCPPRPRIQIAPFYHWLQPNNFGSGIHICFHFCRVFYNLSCMKHSTSSTSELSTS